MTMLTLDELREQYEHEEHQKETARATVKEPQTRTRYLHGDSAYAYGGSKEGEQVEVKEDVIVDEETGIIALGEVVFQDLNPCVHWGSGSCLTRGLPENVVCENCWVVYEHRLKESE